MGTITVNLKQVNDATTEAQVRTHTVMIDRPESKGGHNQGAMGGELLLVSLGGCFNSNLLAAFKARDLTINDITIEVIGNLIENPTRYDAIEMVIHSEFPDREMLEKLVTIAERSCIVANSIKHAIHLAIRVA